MFIARSSIPNRSRATRLVQSVGLYHPPSSCFLTFCLLSFALLEHVACLRRLHRKCSLSVSAFILASPCPSKAEAEAFRNKIVGTLGTLDQIACSTRQLDHYVVITHQSSLVTTTCVLDLPYSFNTIALTAPVEATASCTGHILPNLALVTMLRHVIPHEASLASTLTCNRVFD